MGASSRFAPRAVLSARQTITAELTPFELSLLIRELEERAAATAEHAELVDAADIMFCRVAQLRELMR